MSLEARLAAALMRRHPARAAAALDRLPAADAARLLAAVSAEEGAAVVAGMSPQAATAALETAAVGAAASIVEALEQDVASRLTRRLGDERRAAVLAELPARVRRTLETLLDFPENTAGALMDPDVLALAEDLSAEEALARVREVPDQARYNLYVVDRRQVLVGVVNLRELLLAPAAARLADVMVRDPVRLEARADRSVVVGHPGWKRVHSIPVIDERGGYLGAVRYRTLRQLEDELLDSAETDTDTSEALGEVFASAASGVLDALTGSPAKRRTD